MSAISKDFLVKHGLVVSTTATVLSDSNASSTTTGALTVAGGAGIGKDLWVGGNIYGLSNVNFSGLQIGPAETYPISLSTDGLTTYYTATNTASIVFADGTIQATRAPIAWTNAMFVSAATYLNIDPGVAFQPILLGGLVATGDTYFDDGTFNPDTAGHIYIMTDQGSGVVQFLDITRAA
jgi:hypothetical protein